MLTTLKSFQWESFFVTFADLFASLADSFKLSSGKKIDREFLGFTLDVADPGFGPHNITKSVWRIFRKLFFLFL